MPLPFSLFSLSILIGSVSVILLMTELILGRKKADYGIERKQLKSVGMLIGLIYLVLFFIRLFFST